MILKKKTSSGGGNNGSTTGGGGGGGGEETGDNVRQGLQQQQHERTTSISGSSDGGGSSTSSSVSLSMSATAKRRRQRKTSGGDTGNKCDLSSALDAARLRGIVAEKEEEICRLKSIIADLRSTVRQQQQDASNAAKQEGEDEEESKDDSEWLEEIPVLKLTKDSPYFREEIEVSMERSTELYRQLKRISEAGRKWKKRMGELNKAEASLADALNVFTPHMHANPNDTFAVAACKVGSTLRSLTASRQDLMYVIGSSFLDPIWKFASTEVDQCPELLRSMNKAQNDYQSALSHFLQTKKPMNCKTMQAKNQIMISLAEREHDVLVARERYETCRLGLVRQLNRVEMKRHYELSEAILAGVHSLSGFFDLNQRRFASLVSGVKQVEKHFLPARKFFEEQSKESGTLYNDLRKALTSHIITPTIAKANEHTFPPPAPVETRLDFVRKSVAALSINTTTVGGPPRMEGGNENVQEQHHATVQAKNVTRHSNLAPQTPTATENNTPRSLRQVMQDPLSLNCFAKFMYSEGDAEPMKFWLETEAFKNKDNPGERRDLARQIALNFLLPENTNEKTVVLSTSMKTDLLNKLEVVLDESKPGHAVADVDKTVFEDAQRQVLEVMAADTFPRFLQSDIWAQHQSHLSGVESGGLSSSVPVHRLRHISIDEYTIDLESGKGLEAVESELENVFTPRIPERRRSLALQIVKLSLMDGVQKTNAPIPDCCFDSDEEPHEDESNGSGTQISNAVNSTSPARLDSIRQTSSGVGQQSNASNRRWTATSAQSIRDKLRTWTTRKRSTTPSINANISSDDDNPGSYPVKSPRMRMGTVMKRASVPMPLPHHTRSHSRNKSYEFSADEVQEGRAHSRHTSSAEPEACASKDVMESGGDEDTFAEEDHNQIVKEGYLQKRSSSMRKDWKRRWFVLRESRLYYVRGVEHLNSPVFVCECMLATVREADPGVVNDLQFCFEILSPNRRTYVMQADSEAERQSWVDAIRKCTERMITTRGGGKYANSEESSAARFAAAKAIESRRSSLASGAETCSDPELRQLQLANPECADCGSPCPDWASINLGVLLCIECSGIHRSLGVHISKVRSLTLDRWSPALKGFIKTLGNEKANIIWEHDLETQEGWVKPAANAPRETKEQYIKAKYEWKGFVSEKLHPAHRDGGVNDSTKDLCSCEEPMEKLLMNASENNSVFTLLWHIAHGADVNQILSWRDNKKTTLLHIAAELGHVTIAELLLQNGAYKSLAIQDSEGCVPLDLAMVNNHTELVQVLMERLEH